MATPEILVRGCGILGLSVAYACQSQGARVLVTDPRGIAAGASGGIVGALAPHTPERWDAKKAFQFESLIMADEYWAKIEATSGMPTGYARTGRLQPVANDHILELAHLRHTDAKTLWQSRALWQVLPRDGLGDWAPPSPTGFLIHDTLSARIHPRLATRALAAAFTNIGGRITTDPAPRGAVEVWATGYEGLLELSEIFRTEVGNGVKGQALLLAHDAPHAPQLFIDGLHFIPHFDGTTAIGSTSERYFDTPAKPDALLDEIHTRALKILPLLTGAKLLERWAHVRPRASTRAPMMGALPSEAGIFIANGGFKIGFGMAPKIGAVMADLILNGKNTIPADFTVEANL